MEMIKNWGLLLLFVSAGSLIYCFLVPSGNISSTAKTVVSIIVLSSVTMPLMGITALFGKEKIVFSDPPDIVSYEEEIILKATESTQAVLSQIIKNFTDVPYKTDILIDKTDDGSINIEYIGIIFSAKPEKEKELRDALYAEFRLMPDIRVETVDE